MLISSFVSASLIATNVIGQIRFYEGFGSCLFYVRCLLRSASSLLLQSSINYYSYGDMLIIKIVIPLVNFYLIIVLANNLSKEDMLSKLQTYRDYNKMAFKSLLAQL